jgi:hypothetical protein
MSGENKAKVLSQKYAYKVIETVQRCKLEEQVAELHSKGFRCVGGVHTVGAPDGGIFYLQAMEFVPSPDNNNWPH